MHTTCTITSVKPGSTQTYYPVYNAGAFNFCVVSAAGQVSLLLFEGADATEPCQIIPMFANEANELHAIRWSIRVGTCSKVLYYRFLVNGQQILDPFAVEITDDLHYNGSAAILPKCVARQIKNRVIRRPNIAMSDTVIQEINAYAYSQQGYWGLIDRIGYLKQLCTTVELMPIAQGDSDDCATLDPSTGQRHKEAWYYNTMLYCASSGNLASSRSKACAETMIMVDALHNAGLELVVDFVFNHTREGGHGGPVLHFKALGADRFYVIENGNFSDRHTGCGNELNVFDPMVADMILATLRFWYNVIGVDGIRFDLFAVLALNSDLVRQLLTDPQLQGLKIFPEPWAIGLYVLGQSGTNTCEWNDHFRDEMRDWLRGQFGKAGAFAYCTSGSGGTFQPELNHWSCNFLVCHDGLTLWDVLSWNWKNNFLNGEDNRDGNNDNRSWNCGPDDRYNGSLDPAAPGLTAGRIKQILSLPEKTRAEVLAFRERQYRNANIMLYLSQGVPLDLYGNEIARDQGGNNNAYCQPELVRMPWERLAVKTYADMLSFRRLLFAFRQQIRPNECTIRRHGVTPDSPDYSAASRFAALELVPSGGIRHHVYWASNACDQSLSVTVPAPPPGTRWRLVHDTADGYDLSVEGGRVVENQLKVSGWSNVVLIAR